MAEPFVKCELGNGQRASFWFDNWSPFGSLIRFIGTGGPTSLRVPIHVTVAEAFSLNQWPLASARSANEVALIDHLATINSPLILAQQDLFRWEVQGRSYESYQIAQTWEVLRPKKSVKLWASLVWFKGAIPKHAFNMWIANLNRLPTRSRLVSWGIPIPPACCFCNDYEETREHLLLRCVFSIQIWNSIQVRLRLTPCIFYSWTAFMAWTRMKTESSPPTLRILAAQATIYHIWRQRNNILHNSVSQIPSTIFREIDRDIRNVITARRSRKKFRDLMILWIR